jgi:hypothetical protein
VFSQRKLDKAPTVSEFYGYVFCLHTLLAGPATDYKYFLFSFSFFFFFFFLFFLYYNTTRLAAGVFSPQTTVFSCFITTD